MSKLLMINENTIIKLYNQFVWKDHNHTNAELSALIVTEILFKLKKTKKPHPLKELFLDDEDQSPFYEMVHFVYSTVEDYAKTQSNFTKKLDKDK